MSLFLEIETFDVSFTKVKSDRSFWPYFCNDWTRILALSQSKGYSDSTTSFESILLKLTSLDSLTSFNIPLIWFNESSGQV